MSKKLPFDTLTELARTQKEEAARRLGALQSAQVSAHQKLDLLLQYRQDYSHQLQLLMESGLPASQFVAHASVTRTPCSLRCASMPP